MKKYIITGLGLLLSASGLMAQYTSQLGRFSIDEKRGCAPFTVTLTNLVVGDCTPGKPCAMDYEGNNQEVQNTFTYTYTTPGTYTLKVLYQSIGSDQITVTVDENIQPDFEVYSCAGKGATIKVTDQSFDQYYIDFNNDGTPETIIPNGNNAVASFTYPTTGNKTIDVHGHNVNAADNCSSKVETFTALNNLPAASITSLTVLDDSRIHLKFSISPHILYKLEIAINNSSTFQLLETLYQQDTLEVPNLKTTENYYCFRLNSYDPCNNTNTYSTTICSNKLTLDVQSGVNSLTWETSDTGITSVGIKRDGSSFLNIPGAPTSFDDKDITCNVKYCYQVVSNYPGGSTSTSLEQCGTSFKNTTPVAIVDGSAVVNEPGVDLKWIQPPPDNPSKYTILRSQNRIDFLPITASDQRSFTDDTYTTDGNFCYRIDYADECKNSSPPGSIICPIRLFGDLASTNIITLNWSRFVGWSAGVDHYIVQKFDADGKLINNFNTGTDTTFVDDQDITKHQIVTYTIKAVAVGAGISASVSNPVNFTKEANLFYPTAFTPNGDKLNDSFSLSGQFIAKIEVSIFNRWGEMIFNSSKNEPWNGTFEGKPVEEGPYIWSAAVTDEAGRKLKWEGTVAVLRKPK